MMIFIIVPMCTYILCEGIFPEAYLGSSVSIAMVRAPGGVELGGDLWVL